MAYMDGVTHGFGSLKRLMAYMGIAYAIVFIRTSRPAFDINFSFHPNTCLRNFSSNYLKVFTLDLPQVIGRPRYLSLLVITLAPICCWINLHISGFMFLLKNKEVFGRLIACPDAASYWPRILNSCWHSPTVALQNSKLSSAKRRWEMHTPFWQDIIPFTTRFSTALFNSVVRPSTHRRKR